ncbi:MAG: hypothetical protein JNL70_08670 [Saprospiraceae bacterium]|nr:hypothetical protein [Saprospiraceae bacterium]
MKQIKKIQPKTNTDIDLDMLTQRIRENSQPSIVAEEQPKEKPAPKPKNTPKPQTITKTEEPKMLLPKKKAGRKKQNTDEMHRFAIDLPQWLFDKIKAEADENFSTVRGQILKLLLARYKN